MDDRIRRILGLALSVAQRGDCFIGVFDSERRHGFCAYIVRQSSGQITLDQHIRARTLQEAFAAAARWIDYAEALRRR